jgi:hypothetical protein
LAQRGVTDEAAMDKSFLVLFSKKNSFSSLVRHSAKPLIRLNLPCAVRIFPVSVKAGGLDQVGWLERNGEGPNR